MDDAVLTSLKGTSETKPSISEATISGIESGISIKSHDNTTLNMENNNSSLKNDTLGANINTNTVNTNTINTSTENPGKANPEGQDPKPQDPNENGTFTLLFFASASTYTNVESISLPAPMTLRTMFGVLEERFPGMGAKVLRGAGVVRGLEYLDFEVEDYIGEEGHGRGERGEGERERSLREKGGVGEGRGDEIVFVRGDEVAIVPPVSSG